MDPAKISTGKDVDRQAATDIDPYLLGAALDLDRRTYRVAVKRQGVYVTDYVVKAPDALSAINQVESYYGDPVRLRRRLSEDRRQIVLIGHWHGYMFEATAIEEIEPMMTIPVAASRALGALEKRSF